MIQINPLQSYIDGGARAAIVSPPSASLVFDLPGKAIWVKGVKLKGTDHTYTFSHDNYISLTNTPGSSESEDILIGINTTLLKQAIDTTYGVVSASADGLAPMFSSANTASASAATTYNFLGITGTSLKWFQLPWRNVRINADTTDKLGVNDTDPLIISSGDGISVTWDSTGKKIVITNSAPDQNHNTDSSVAQIRNTQNKNYPLILKGGTGSDGIISSVNFNESITYNPSTKILAINGNQVVTLADIYSGATASDNATTGLVPAATSSERNSYLRGDGTWQSISSIVSNYTTWRPIKVGGTEKLGSGTDTGSIDFAAGTGISLSWDATNKRITITNDAPDVNHNTHYTTSMYIGENNDTAANKAVTSNPYLKLFDDTTRRSTLRFVAGTGIAIKSDANGNITITNSSPDLDHNTDYTTINKGTAGSTTEVSQVKVLSSAGVIFEGGTNEFKVGDGTNYFEVPVTPSFTITDKSASILSSLTTLATIAGTDIKAKVVVEDKAATLTTTSQTIATVAGVDITAKITNYNTDENVKQTPKTDNVNRPLMMINGGTSAGELTSTSMFSTSIYANASSKMITANGYIKAGSDDTSVLLAGGGAKALSDFATSTHDHDSNYVIRKYYSAEQNTDATKFWIRDIALDYPCSVIYNNSGSEWTYWVGLNTSNKQYGHIIRCSYANSGTLQFMYKSGGTADNTTNWSGWINVAHSNNSSLSTSGTTATIKVLGSSADVSLTSHNHNSSYVTAVGNGSGDYINNLYYTLNGSNKYFTVNYATNATLLLYQSMLGYRNDFDNFTNVAGLRVALFQNKGTEADGTNLVNLPFGDGSLLSFPWGGDNRYGAQLAVEDAGSTNHLAIRCRTGAANTWGAWAMILTSANYNLYSPKLDGTGASGTWAISISGNSATATILLTARTINGVSFNGSANISIAPSLLISGNTIASQVGDQTSSYITVPYATSTTNATKLISSGSITQDTINSFCEASVFKMAYLSNEAASALSIGSDGFLFSVGVSGGYGHLIHIDDTAYNIWHRKTKGPNLNWDSWVKILDTSNISPSLDISGNTIRVTTGGVSSSYITVPYAISAGNADTLDGYHFSNLEDRYVNVTGDTMSGVLTFATNDAYGLAATANYSQVGFVDRYFWKGHINNMYSNNISSLNETGAPTFPNGLISTGTITANGGIIVNGVITFGTNDSYGLAATANYSLIGFVDRYFWKAHVANVYASNISSLNESGAPNFPNGLTSGGNITATHFYESSDIHLKHDISSISKSIRKFRFNDDNKLYYGFVALELEVEHPELVDSSGEYKTVNYSSAICYYIAELENKVQKLEERIRKFESSLA